MEISEDIVGRIREQLPFGLDPDLDIREDSLLAELGISSVQTLAILMGLQRDYHLQGGWIARIEMPKSVGDVINLVGDAACAKQPSPESGARLSIRQQGNSRSQSSEAKPGHTGPGPHVN